MSKQDMQIIQQQLWAQYWMAKAIVLQLQSGPSTRPFNESDIALNRAQNIIERMEGMSEEGS